MDIVTFFSVVIFLWISYTPKLSISLHLLQAEFPLFNRSLVIDNLSHGVAHNLKGNHLSYLYAPWDAQSLRHTDDVELFMGSYFGHASPVLNYPYSETWSVRELTAAILEELRVIVANFKGSNLLLLPHLSTAFPSSVNISDHSPLIFLFTDSHSELDSSYDQDVYMSSKEPFTRGYEILLLLPLLDFISLANHLLKKEFNPYEAPTSVKGIDGMLAVARINRLCCEFAVAEATDQVGVFDTAKVRTRALALISEQARPRYSRICSKAKVVNYAHVRTPKIEALGCHRWGNGSLTFSTVSIHNPPPWVEVFFGNKSNLPKVAIVDSKAEVVYTMKSSLSYENLGLNDGVSHFCRITATFISHFHNGTLQRHLFSDERVVSRRRVGFLHQAHSAAHLESLIGLNSKDVVVLFFGRHCGYTTHGRGVLYEFQSVAKHLAHQKSLLFVVVDVDVVQLPWSLTVEYIPIIILFPRHQKSNSIVFPKALLSTTNLYSNLVKFLNKRINHSTNSTTIEDSFRLVEHLNVHIARISSAEGVLEGLLQRLVIGLQELSIEIRKHTFQYILATESGRMTLHRLLFIRDRLSFQWGRFLAAKERLVKERSIAKTARAHLLSDHI
ncbi:unnamed protein product [Hydatigera taeniaeformis]|uniref:Thioredoxin domain-containing protein n=1 Tax=Hydatigena taeniaeformis TaxID=6205 RepID=A0A0R3WJ07_HYDTA|nr:unnamed protein product [Hydatigera taeniaeformis]